MCRPIDTFTCGNCGSPKTNTTYALLQNVKICDDCANEASRNEAETNQNVFAYLSADGKTITNWTGFAIATVFGCYESKAGFCGMQTYVQCVTPKGRKLYGRGPGKGCYIRLKAVKK